MNYSLFFMIPVFAGSVVLSSCNQPRAEGNGIQIQSASIFPAKSKTVDSLQSDEVALMKKWRLFDNLSLRDGNGIVAQVAMFGQPAQFIPLRQPAAEHLTTDTVDVYIPTYKRGRNRLLFKGTARFPNQEENNFLYRYKRSDDGWKLVRSSVGS